MSSSEKQFQTLLKAIKESEERYRAILDQSGDSIFIIELKTLKILETNQSFRKLLGFTPENIENLSLFDFFAHKSEDINEIINQILEEQRSYLGERRYRMKDGSIIDVEVRASLIHFLDQHLISMVSRDITERKRIEQQLKESEEKYRLICEKANDLIAIINDRFEFEYINERVHLEKMQYTKEDLIGKSGLDFAHPDHMGSDLEQLIKGFQTGEGHMETQLRRKDGKYLWFDVKGSTFRDKDNKLKAIMILRDMTDRKKNQQQLIESEEKFRSLFEESPNSIILVNNNGIILDCNAITAQNLGINPENLIGKSFQELTKLFCPEDLPLLVDVFDTLRSGFIPKPLELRINPIEGPPLWISVKISLIELQNQIYIQAIIQNITEQKLAEQLIRESEQKYRVISENANDLINIINREYKVEFVNEEAHNRILGYSKEELVGHNGLDLLHPDDLQKAVSAFQSGIQKGTGSTEIRLRHKDGYYLWFEIKGKTFFDKNGDLKGILISRNITERKKAAEDLAKSETKYRNLLQNISDIVVELAGDGIFLYVSPQIRPLLGYTQGEIIGKNGLDFIHPDDVPHVLEKLRESLTSEGQMHVEYRVRHKDGHYVDVAVNGGAIQEDGKVKHVGVIRDISKQKDLERVQNQFYQEISQEINSPLVMIKEIAEILIGSTNLDELQRTNLQKILKNEARIEQLMHELFSYSRLKLGLAQFKKEKFYASDIVKEIREEYDDLITSKNLIIKTTFEPDSTLSLDKTQITKVVRNLFDNAVKFSFPNGIIFIESIISDQTWTFSIHDRGIGISKQEFEKLFKHYPGFVDTDKLYPSGYGIGLAVCKRIIDVYNGRIWGISEGPNKGAIFTFEINLDQ